MLVLLLSTAFMHAAEPTPPVAKRIPHEIVMHGEKRVDDYFWLRERTNAQVTAYLEAENSYTEAMMRPTQALQTRLYEEMLSHLKETDSSAPVKRGEYFYYARTEKGKDYEIQCRKKGSLDAVEEVVLDENEMAKGYTFFDVGIFLPSDDNRFLAYTTDTNGYRQFTLRIKDLGTGKLLGDHFERVTSLVWTPDNQTLFYCSEHPVTKRSDEVHRYRLGSGKSERVYFEPDELYDVEVDRTLDREFILISSTSKLTSEVRYLSTRPQHEAAFRVLEPRSGEHKYYVSHRQGLFYILSNDQAKNYRVMTVPTSTPHRSNWKELIPHDPAVKIESIELFMNHLVLSGRADGLDRLEVRDFKTGTSHVMEMDEPIYSAGLRNNLEFDSELLRFGYQSLVRPDSVYEYHMGSRKRRLVKQKEVPGYNPNRYQSERIFAAASDGTKIPLSIVQKRATRRHGKNPLLLIGYGSYGVSVSPAFSYERLALLDRGVIYAIAHIRGGGEMGENWREQGRMMRKKTTFSDFIACAEHLIAEKYTSPERLGIAGGSAGGLLMGAVLNMRPDLFRAATAYVPFVDVLNTMSDASLPLTTSEYIEWGNPAVKAEYEYMKSYSPYDNVRSETYPALLVRTSFNDSQVPYWEGAKWAAKLRSMKTGSMVLLLKTNMGAGHGGASGRYDSLKDDAFDFAFLLTQLGVEKRD
jgi:oligopeptidase B